MFRVAFLFGGPGDGLRLTVSDHAERIRFATMRRCGIQTHQPSDHALALELPKIDVHEYQLDSPITRRWE